MEIRRYRGSAYGQDRTWQAQPERDAKSDVLGINGVRRPLEPTAHSMTLRSLGLHQPAEFPLPALDSTVRVGLRPRSPRTKAEVLADVYVTIREGGGPLTVRDTIAPLSDIRFAVDLSKGTQRPLTIAKFAFVDIAREVVKGPVARLTVSRNATSQLNSRSSQKHKHNYGTHQCHA